MRLDSQELRTQRSDLGRGEACGEEAVEAYGAGTGACGRCLRSSGGIGGRTRRGGSEEGGRLRGFGGEVGGGERVGKRAVNVERLNGGEIDGVFAFGGRGW